MKGGIINPEIWNRDKTAGICRNILVILKEAPCSDKFDLRGHIIDGAKGNTYNNVAMWVFLLRHFRRDNVDVSIREAHRKKNPSGPFHFVR